MKIVLALRVTVTYSSLIDNANGAATMDKKQELAVRKASAKHLTGIPAMQNMSAIDLLETEIAYEEIVERFGADEIARWERMEGSIYA